MTCQSQQVYKRTTRPAQASDLIYIYIGGWGGFAHVPIKLCVGIIPLCVVLSGGGHANAARCAEWKYLGAMFYPWMQLAEEIREGEGAWVCCGEWSAFLVRRFLPVEGICAAELLWKMPMWLC